MSEQLSISRPDPPPPFEGTIVVVASSSWEEELRNAIEGAAERHLGPEQLRDYGHSSALNMRYGGGPGRSLGDILTGRRYEVEETIDVPVRVPLFRLHAPAVDGAKVTYSQKIESSGEAGWEIKVFGTGLGSSVTLKASHTTKYETSNGACKRIFLPVTIQVSRLGIYRGGDRVGTTIRTEVSRKGTEGGFVNGIELLRTADCALVATSDRRLFTIPAIDDSTGAPLEHEQTFAIGGSFEASLGLKAFDVESSVKAKVERQQEVSLGFTVPGGHDYDVYAPSGIDGIACVVR